MTPTYDQTVREFRDYLQQIGYGKSSVCMLPDCVKPSWRARGTSPIEEMTSADIVRFYKWLRQRPNKRKEGALSEQYINHHLLRPEDLFRLAGSHRADQENPIST